MVFEPRTARPDPRRGGQAGQAWPARAVVAITYLAG